MGRPRDTENLSPFGKYLQKQKLERIEVAKVMDVTTSYVSMLARGQAMPGFKSALKFSAWTEKKFGTDNAFLCEDWYEA